MFVLRIRHALNPLHRFAGDIQAFADQVRLVFANCLAYNPPGCWARTWGESCGGAFEVR